MTIAASLNKHAIVAGFGVPGRAMAEWFAQHGVPACVIELNPHTVQRCERFGLDIIAGNVADEATLREAGIERARILALAVPDDHAVLDAITVARRLNPSIQIIARCAFISAGLEATRRGATQVVVAEQVVAHEMVRHIEKLAISTAPPAARS